MTAKVGERVRFETGSGFVDGVITEILEENQVVCVQIDRNRLGRTRWTFDYSDVRLINR